jgi:hypothetical protein
MVSGAGALFTVGVHDERALKGFNSCLTVSINFRKLQAKIHLALQCAKTSSKTNIIDCVPTHSTQEEYIVHDYWLEKRRTRLNAQESPAWDMHATKNCL